MSDITKLWEYFPYVAVLFIPGFVYTISREFLIGRNMQPITLGEAIRIVLRSIVVNTVTELILVLIHHTLPAEAFFHTMEEALVNGNLYILIGNVTNALNTLAVFMVLPSMYGILIGGFKRLGWSPSDWLRRNFRILAQVSDQATDQAMFDSLYKCSQENKVLIIGVWTKGGMLYGRFGSKSMLSHSGGYRDLYLEETWEEDQNGSLAKASDASSMLIKGSVIEALIFFYI